jgi:hypothetical protein
MIRKSFGRRICNSRLQVNTPSTFRSVASVIFICRKTKNDFYNLPRAISQSLWICHHNAVLAGRMPLPVVLSGGGSGAGSASGNPSRSLAPSQRAPPPPLPKERGGESRRPAKLLSHPSGGRRAASATMRRVDPESRRRFVCRRRQSLPEIERRTYLCRHGETVQPNFKPPRAIEQTVGPDEYEASDTGAIGPESLGICAVKLFMSM